MEANENKSLDYLSSLLKAIEDLETEILGDAAVLELSCLNNELAGELIGIDENNYRLGKTLIKFKAPMKDNKKWTTFLEGIAKRRGCCSATLRRLAENTLAAEPLPQWVKEAMLLSHIDPSKKENSAQVKTLIEMPTPSSPEQAQAQVRVVHGQAVADKSAKRISKPSSSNPTLQAVACRMAKLFKGFFGKEFNADKNEQLRYVLEVICSALGAKIEGLRSYSRTDDVPKPESLKAA